MKVFRVVRSKDVSGISGTGIIAEGVRFHDGQIAISWFGKHQLTEIGPDIDTWLAVHGHGGLTTVEWLNDIDTENIMTTDNKGNVYTNVPTPVKDLTTHQKLDLILERLDVLEEGQDLQREQIENIKDRLYDIENDGNIGYSIDEVTF